MKGNKTRAVALIFGLVLMLAIPVLARTETTVVTYTEDFDAGTSGDNPSSTWYTYEERGYTAANITNTENHSAPNSYFINDANGYTGGIADTAWFNFTEHDYSYFEFWFKINNVSQEDTRISFYDGANLIGRLDIGNRTGGDDTVMYLNHSATEIFNVTLDNDSWYKFRLEFNYTTSEAEALLYNSTSTLLNDSWTDAGTITGIDSISIAGYNLASSYIYFDDAATSYSYTTEYTLADDITPSLYALITIMFVLGLLGLVMKSFEKWFH